MTPEQILALHCAYADLVGAKQAFEQSDFTHDVVLPSQEQIVHVQATAHSGWLYHDKGKTYYALFASLSDCLNRENPIKEWEHNSEYPCFEDDVIDYWLMTGWDAP